MFERLIAIKDALKIMVSDILNAPEILNANEWNILNKSIRLNKSNLQIISRQTNCIKKTYQMILSVCQEV